MGDPRPLWYRFLGRCAYQPTWDLQRALAHRLQQQDPEANELLLAVEHDPVITLGRRGRFDDILLSRDALAARGVEVHEVDRGGEVTYHGPGQLVVYPIVRVDPRRFGVGDLVRGLAGAIAELLEPLGIDARYDRENPGLWAGSAKICAVGMRVSRGVSTHGAALNVSNDVGAFDWIVPCGMPNARVTSMANERGPGRSVPSLAELASRLADRFARRFDFARVDPTEAQWREYLDCHVGADIPL